MRAKKRSSLGGMKHVSLMSATIGLMLLAGGAKGGAVWIDEPKTVATPTTTEKAVEPAKVEKPDYARSVEDEAAGTIRLEIASRSLQKADGTGPVIMLVGAVHIGDASYYDGLQKLLDEQTVVLYEGVKPAGTGELALHATDEQKAALTTSRIKLLVRLVERSAQENAGAWPQDLTQVLSSEPKLAKIAPGLMKDAWGREMVLRITPPTTDRDGSPIGESQAAVVSLGSDGAPGGEGPAADIEQTCRHLKAGKKADAGLQKKLAEALGLEFQLERMDSTKSNWRNSDMSVDEVQRRIEENGGDSEMLFSMLDGSSAMGKVAGMLLGLIKMSPQMQSMTKVMMIEILSSDDAMGAMGNAGGKATGPMAAMAPVMKVILHDRNQVVVADIKNVLKNEPGVKSIAAFYGAGHLPELELQLREELGLKVIGESWHPAMTMDLKKAGMSIEEVRQMRKSVSGMMKQRGGAGAGAGGGSGGETTKPEKK